MNQGFHTVNKEMPRTWQHLSSLMQARWLEHCSYEVRFIFDCSSVIDRTTTEQQPKNNRRTGLSTTNRIRGNSEASTNQEYGKQ